MNIMLVCNHLRVQSLHPNGAWIQSGVRAGLEPGPLGLNSSALTMAHAPSMKLYTVTSLVSQHPRELKKKCPLVELSAYENYSHKRTPEKNRVDGRLQGS